MYYIHALAPTLDYSEGALLKLPYDIRTHKNISELALDNITMCKVDWNAAYGNFPIDKIELDDSIFHGAGFHTYGALITDKSVIYLKDPPDMKDAEEL